MLCSGPRGRCQVTVQGHHQHRYPARLARIAFTSLDRVDRVLERGVVELDHAGPARPARLQSAGQVRVDEVETARAECEIEGLGVDQNLITLAHRAQQRFIGPGRPALPVDLDDQRLLLDDDTAPQLQQDATSASATSSI